AVERDDQGDEALAAPGIVAGEILVVGAGGGDEAIEPARLELGPRAVEAALEDLRPKGLLLARLRISDCGLRIRRIRCPPRPIRNPQSPSRNCNTASRHKRPPLHCPSPSSRCGLYYAPPADPGRRGCRRTSKPESS